MDYLSLPIGENAPDTVLAVVEIPQNGRNKYEYDRALQVFRLDRTLASSLHFPGDYGFIPQTIDADDEPLDVLVLGDSPGATGLVAEVRPVGLLETLDQGAPDAKVIAMAVGNPKFHAVRSYADAVVRKHVLREVEHFFATYKDLEGRRTQVLGWRGAEAARQTIVEAHARYARQLQPR